MSSDWLAVPEHTYPLEPSELRATYASHWQLNPRIDFLNHGSFGATPTRILNLQRGYRDALEWDPIEFLAPERSLEPKLDRVRETIARLVNANAQDIAFVQNATEGVNAVLDSFPWTEGDEMVVTNHGYNACTNAAHFATQRLGAKVCVAEIPFPIESEDQVIAAIDSVVTNRTRLILVDHVTSPTGLVLPIGEIAKLAKRKNVRVLVDGAHAPGMLPVDLRDLDVDYYTANHHKWLCAPKASGFLWVRDCWQTDVRPTVISHAANRGRPGRSKFIAEFDWKGTYDPTALMCVPDSIEFLASLFPDTSRVAQPIAQPIDQAACDPTLVCLMQSNRSLALKARRILTDAIGIKPPSPASMIGSLVAVPLPSREMARRTEDQNDPRDALQRTLRNQHRFELPIYPGPVAGSRLLRISLQAYNTIQQVQRLADILHSYVHP